MSQGWTGRGGALAASAALFQGLDLGLVLWVGVATYRDHLISEDAVLAWTWALMGLGATVGGALSLAAIYALALRASPARAALGIVLLALPALAWASLCALTLLTVPGGL